MSRTPVVLACLFAGLVILAPATASAGYTHYWTWKADPDPATLRATVAEMKRLADARASILEVAVAEDGTSISINGIGDDAYEPFIFPYGWDDRRVNDQKAFHFCKTAWKPYDEVVTAALLVAADHFPRSQLSVDSDGDWEAWEPGRDLYQAVLGRTPHAPFSVRPLVLPPGVGPLSLYNSGLIGLIVLVFVLYFLFGRSGAGGGGGLGGWGTYYLFWFVAPMLVAVFTSHPFVLAAIVVGFVFRRWLPDPFLFFKYSGRIRSLDHMVTANAGNVTARRDLAVIWLDMRRPRRALPLVEEALRLDPKSIELFHLKGLALLAARRYDEAALAFATVAQTEPRFRYGEAYLRGGDAFVGQKKWPEAADALEGYLEINRSSVEARFKLARTWKHLGKAEAAETLRREARQIYRELPVFQRRKQLGWYLRTIVG